MIELNKEQIEQIEWFLNCVSGEMRTFLKCADPERFSRACGKSLGADRILDAIGYEAVWDYGKERMFLRRMDS